MINIFFCETRPICAGHCSGRRESKKGTNWNDENLFAFSMVNHSLSGAFFFIPSKKRTVLHFIGSFCFLSFDLSSFASWNSHGQISPVSRKKKIGVWLRSTQSEGARLHDDFPEMSCCLRTLAGFVSQYTCKRHCLVAITNGSTLQQKSLGHAGSSPWKVSGSKFNGCAHHAHFWLHLARNAHLLQLARLHTHNACKSQAWLGTITVSNNTRNCSWYFPI